MTSKVKKNLNTQPDLIDFMPQSQAAQTVLAERAARLAIEASVVVQQNELTNYVRFKIGEKQWYGIPYDYIKEIISNVYPTPVPYADQYISGIINRYGALISVIDIEKYFHIAGTKDDDQKNNLIIISGLGIITSFLVNAIDDSVLFDTKNLNPALQFNGSIPAKYVLGIHDKTTVILNIETILLDLQVDSVKTKEH